MQTNAKLLMMNECDGERFKTVADCTYNRTEKGVLIEYSEKGSHTVISINESCAEIKRQGEMSYTMPIVKKMPVNFKMQTPYGEMYMRTFGKKIELEKSALTCTAFIEYEYGAHGGEPQINRIKLKVRK